MENGNKPLMAEERIKERINQIALEKSSSPSDWGWIEQYMIEGYKIAKEEFANQPKPVVSEELIKRSAEILLSIEDKGITSCDQKMRGVFEVLISEFGLSLQSDGKGSDAVEFANWIRDRMLNDSWFRPISFIKGKWYVDLRGHLTTQEIYELFTQSKNQK